MLIQFDRPNLRIDSIRYPQHLVLILLSRNLTPTSVTCELDSFDQLLAPTRVHYLDGDQRIIRATSDNGLQVSEYAVSFESMYDPDTRRRQPFEFRVRVRSLYLLEDRNYHTRDVEFHVTFPLVGGVGTLTLNPTPYQPGIRYDIASSVELRPPNIVQLCDANEITTSYRRTHAGRVRSPEAHALRDWRIANAELSVAASRVDQSPQWDGPDINVEFPSLDQIENAVTELTTEPRPDRSARLAQLTTEQVSALLAERAIDLEQERELLREELNPKVAPKMPTSRFVRPNLDTDELLPSDASLDQSPPKSSLSGEGKREGD